MNTPLLVGCPVWKRGWALWEWFHSVEVAAERIHIEPAYVFAADPRDTDSMNVIETVIANLDRECFVTWVEESPDLTTAREWNASRYHRMVDIRNELLNRVREVHPMMFFSLDSDIFLHAEALEHLIEGLEHFDAVGGKAYMTPDGTQFPSFMNLNNGIERHDHTSGPVPVDVIMAIKLMSPAAYAIDYRWDHQGEDIGWSKACAEAGLKLGWDGRITNKHVMAPELVSQVDRRCGF